jgi:hypothetical protein
MTPRPLITLGLSLLLGGVSTLFAPGCSGEDGQTPNCPPLSLYDINRGAAGETSEGQPSAEQIAQERAEAVDAGCMTDLGDASTAVP